MPNNYTVQTISWMFSFTSLSNEMLTKVSNKFPKVMLDNFFFNVCQIVLNSLDLKGNKDEKTSL